MTLGNFFSLGDLQNLVNYDSFEGESTPSFLNIPFEQGEDVTKRCQMNPKHWIHSQNGSVQYMDMFKYTNICFKNLSFVTLESVASLWQNDK